MTINCFPIRKNFNENFHCKCIWISIILLSSDLLTVNDLQNTSHILSFYSLSFFYKITCKQLIANSYYVHTFFYFLKKGRPIKFEQYSTQTKSHLIKVIEHSFLFNLRNTYLKIVDTVKTKLVNEQYFEICFFFQFRHNILYFA